MSETDESVPEDTETGERALGETDETTPEETGESAEAGEDAAACECAVCGKEFGSALALQAHVTALPGGQCAPRPVRVAPKKPAHKGLVLSHRQLLSFAKIWQARLAVAVHDAIVELPGNVRELIRNRLRNLVIGRHCRSRGKGKKKSFVPSPLHTELLLRESREPKPVQRELIMIPESCAGWVIGKNGISVKRLQQVSGVTIDIPRKSGGGPDEREVTLTAESHDSIENAKKMIQELVDEKRSIQKAEKEARARAQQVQAARGRGRGRGRFAGAGRGGRGQMARPVSANAAVQNQQTPPRTPPMQHMEGGEGGGRRAGRKRAGRKRNKNKKDAAAATGQATPTCVRPNSAQKTLSIQSHSCRLNSTELKQLCWFAGQFEEQPQRDGGAGIGPPAEEQRRGTYA
eukprot:COSAG06_NODE_7910_length_2335_cov_230.733453_1_plen_404_part_00